jgi:hypothetical protein
MVEWSGKLDHSNNALAYITFSATTVRRCARVRPNCKAVGKGTCPAGFLFAILNCTATDLFLCCFRSSSFRVCRPAALIRGLSCGTAN